MEIIGGASLFIGLMITVVAWNQYPKDWGLLGGSLCMYVGGVMMFMPGYSVLGTMMVLGGIGIASYKLKDKFTRIKKDKLECIGGTPLDRFFVECVLSECNDFSKPKNVARAKLLADKYKLSYPDGVESLYMQGYEAHTAVSGRIESDAMEELRKAERAEYERMNRYAYYHGKEKKAAMLRDRMKELRDEAKSKDRYADMLMRSVTEQEQDWSIWGGIADGLAGPAAGVSMAIDIQQQNAQIRARNEANSRAAMPYYMTITGSASQNRANADAIEKELSLLQEKLVEDAGSEEVLKLLEISNSVVEVSKTGAFRVSATVEPKKPLYIYGDVPATADGTIVAHVFEEGIDIGRVNMVLPVNGASSKTGVMGIALSGADPTKKQRVVFTADNLWLQEQ